MKRFKLFFSFIFLFFISVGVTKAEQCIQVPRCSNGEDTYVSRCFSVTPSTTIIFESSILENYYVKTSDIAVNPDSARVLDSFQIPVPEATGFRFEGWYYNGQKIYDTQEIIAEYEITQITGTTCYFDSDGNYAGDRTVGVPVETGFEDIYLSARWEPLELTINYVVPGEGETTRSYIDGDLMQKLPEPNADGYVSYAWYYDANFTQPVENEYIGALKFIPIYGDNYNGYGDIVTAYEPLTLYAKLAASCVGDSDFNLFYETNGGTEFNSEIINLSTSDQITEKLPTPTKTGYKFEGWYYDAELTNKVDTDLKVELKPGTEPDANACPMLKDVTLYAKWVADASQVPDGDDAYNGALDPGNGSENGSGLEDDDVPNTGAGASFVVLLVLAGLAIGMYLYVWKNDKIKRLI